MRKPIVKIDRLTRRFGSTLALNDVSLEVQPGLVYGLVGGNGQGKTTLIKHLLGLLRAQTGTVEVFGKDPVQDPVGVLSRVGYLSENREMPDWMRIDELLRYTSAFHETWDFDLANELVQTFRLDTTKRIDTLSKGTRAQTGLIAAVAPRPDLLLLDEPSTGLDAVVRKDILNAIVRTVADDGRTTIFSSHLLDEVEQMSDYIFMIDQGKLILAGELDQIKQQHVTFLLRLSDGIPGRPQIQGALSVEPRGEFWNVVLEGAPEQARESAQRINGEITRLRNANLNEIFVARVGRELSIPTTGKVAS